MNLKRKNLNKPRTKENKPTKTNINLNSKFQILTSDARGITLIALVITIIVMLILVAVTIQVATNGNLFKHAGNAVKETKNAVLYENFILNGGIKVGGVAYNSIDEYILSQTSGVNIEQEQNSGGSQLPEPTVVSIEAYDEDDTLVGTYDSIEEAAQHAGEYGRVVLPAGQINLSHSQELSVEGITLEGAGKGSTVLGVSSDFGDSVNGNSCILLVDADYVTIKNLSINTEIYGQAFATNDYCTWVNSVCYVGGDVSFIPLRLESGEGVELRNLELYDSCKCNILIGTESTSTTVTASGVGCFSPVRSLDCLVYSTEPVGVYVADGSEFTVTSSHINSPILPEDEDSLSFDEPGIFYPRIERTFLFVQYRDISMPVDHWIRSWYMTLFLSEFRNGDGEVLSSSSHKTAWRAISRSHDSLWEDVTDVVAVSGGNQELIGMLIDIFSNTLSDGYNDTIYSCRTRCQAVYTGD